MTSSTVRLHVLSDLHLRQGGLAVPRTDAEVVILAGDIARPAQAIEWMRGFPQPVVYVPGNHEFYGGSIGTTVTDIRALAAGSNIHVLDRDELVLGSIRFLGTTLWTDFMLLGDGPLRAQAMDEAIKWNRDFSRIASAEIADAPFTPEESTRVFARDRDWLVRKLAEPFVGPTVVITHHAPSPRSIHPRFAGSLLNCCFVSDLEAQMGRDRAVLWVHGHTHDSFDYAVRGTRVICNPRGYAKDGANENAAFDPNLILAIDVANRCIAR